jgi:CysZ protein
MRSRLGEIVAGLRVYVRAWNLIRTHRLWPWLLFPGVISLIYFPGIIAATAMYMGDLETYLRERWLPAFLQARVLSWMVTIAVWLAILYAGFILFRNVLMILYAPFLSHLSAKVEEKAEGSPLAVPPARFLPGVLRAVSMSLLSLALALGSLFVGLLLLVIPILGGLLMPVFLTCSQMVLAGHGFMDPTWERHGYGVGRSFGMARRHRWRCLGCGAGFVFLTAIPIVGWFLGPAVGMVAGTLAALDLEASSNPPLPPSENARSSA